MNVTVMCTQRAYKGYTKQQLNKVVGLIKQELGNNSRDRNRVRIRHNAIGDLFHAGHALILSELDRNRGTVNPKTGRVTGASDQQFIKTALFGLDIENNGLTLEDILRISDEHAIRPLLVYTTKSHNPVDDPRYRAVFLLERELTDAVLCRDYIARLIGLFKGDPKAKDLSRVFYPGNEIVYRDDNAVNSQAAFDALPITEKMYLKGTTGYRVKKQVQTMKQKSNPRLPAFNQEIEAIRSLDWERMRSLLINRGRGSVSSNTDNDCNNLKRRVSTKLTEELEYKEYIILKIFPQLGRTSEPIEKLIGVEDGITTTSQGEVVLSDAKDIYKVFDRVEISTFLNLPTPGEKFNCIFDHHKDQNASATIEYLRKEKEHKQIYHCYGCGEIDQFYDLLNLIEILADCSHLEAKDFLAKTLGVIYETPWMKEKKQEIQEFQKYLQGGMFEKQFPGFYKVLVGKNKLGALTVILDMAQWYLYDLELVSDRNLPVFHASAGHIASIMKAKSMRGCSISAVEDKIKFYQKIGLINVLQDRELPKKYINKLHREVENCCGHRYHNHPTVFSIPAMNKKLIADAQKAYQENYVDGKVRARYYGKKQEILISGPDGAQKIYCQSTKFSVDPKVMRFYEKYRKLAERMLKERGYVYDQDLLKMLRGYSLKEKKTQLGVCLPRILKDLNLKTVPYTKALAKSLKTDKAAKLHYGGSKVSIPKTNEKEV